MDRERLREAHAAADRYLAEHHPPPVCSPALGAVAGFFFCGTILVLLDTLGEVGGWKIGAAASVVLATAAPYLYLRSLERERYRIYADRVAAELNFDGGEA